MSILLQGSRFKKRLVLLLLSLALASCSSSFTSVLQNDANASSEFYMNKLDQTTEVEDKQTYKLLAARVLIDENKIAQSEALLGELTDLNDAQKLDRTLIEAQISAVKGNNEQAESQLKLIDLSKLSPSQTARYYAVQAKIAENRQDVLAAVKAHIKIDENLTDVQRKQQNNDQTWALLRSANTGVINNASDEANPALGGWLALIKIYNDNLNQPSQLSQALQNWKTSYPNHTAAYLLPKELQGLLNFQQTSLNQIGLLLPLTANAQIVGSTVQTGFNEAKGDSSIQVKVYDTANLSVSDIVAQAKQDGIKTLVGPLLKQNLNMLLANPADLQGIDVLALNTADNMSGNKQMCYYGLSPEDEARSAATKMWNDGVRNPLVAVPQNDLGQRIANAFNVRWQQLAATDANVRYYNVPEDIKFDLGEETNPSKAIYTIATPDELVEMKTAVDSVAPNLKIYASSRSNVSSNTPEFKAQMNGVQFTDIPFFKETDSSQYQKIASATNSEYQLMRLYAMGSDAWLLINHINELRQVPGYSLNGLTGKLHADSNCNIQRDMTWFQYQNGEMVPVSN